VAENSYETPKVTDYGELRDLTANNEIPLFVDVPQGTQVGSDPFPEMS
jgi:hypothetical protein